MIKCETRNFPGEFGNVGTTRVKAMNLDELEPRPVLGPAGNQVKSMDLGKSVSKLKVELAQKPLDVDETKGKKSPAPLLTMEIGTEKIRSPVDFRKNARDSVSNLRQRQLSLSFNASCSSDASSDSSQSKPSMGRVSRRIATPTTPPFRKKQLYSSRVDKFEKMMRNRNNVGGKNEGLMLDVAGAKNRCAWVTSNTDTSYAAFHDEEWGFPVHDDNKLFELLSFSTALAELAWPVILSKRHLFRDVFLDFDPIAVSKLNEKKIATPGSPASSLLSELKLRGIIENARQLCKIKDEFESFNKYIWGFVNYKAIVGHFRYPRQVPIRTSKADTISKDLVRRGFRGVGPTVVYSFMQVAGITNDHLINCFRYQDCMISYNLTDISDAITLNNGENQPEDHRKFELVRDTDRLSVSRP